MCIGAGRALTITLYSLTNCNPPQHLYAMTEYLRLKSAVMNFAYNVFLWVYLC